MILAGKDVADKGVDEFQIFGRLTELFPPFKKPGLQRKITITNNFDCLRRLQIVNIFIQTCKRQFFKNSFILENQRF